MPIILLHWSWFITYLSSKFIASLRFVPYKFCLQLHMWSHIIKEYSEIKIFLVIGTNIWIIWNWNQFILLHFLFAYYWLLVWLNLQCWRWRQYVSTKCWWTFTRLQGISIPEECILLNRTVRTANPTKPVCFPQLFYEYLVLFNIPAVIQRQKRKKNCSRRNTEVVERRISIPI